MEQSYWLGRKRSAAANARRAGSSRARLVHLDLAGRYSVMAAAAAAVPSAAGEGSGLRLSPPESPDWVHYERLEIGARWLASRAATEAERQEHLGTANGYARQRLEAVAER
ncbi:MAG TPA: hypothetical protein VK472_08140 [Allosphingosinicella sp.]|nr:hypothetical protein [Allosphingosinicella sp.]